MQAHTTVLLSLALAVGAGVATQLALRPAAAEAAPARAADAVQPAPDRAPQAELSALRSEVAALRAQLAAVSASAGEGARAPAVDLDAAIAAWFEQNHPGLAAGEPAAAPEAAGEAPPTAAALLTELLAPGLSQAESQALWDRAREAGLVEELVAAFEAYAESRPDDPDAQCEVGNAYLKQLETVPDGPQKGMIASRADQAFDRALAVDPEHWEARFTKAVSLSFWPPVFGKQAEAIRQFEVIVQQQATQPLNERNSTTYELLGNLYLQSGQRDKAAAIWEQGLGLFPQDASLAQKLSALGDE